MPKPFTLKAVFTENLNLKWLVDLNIWVLICASLIYPSYLGFTRPENIFLPILLISLMVQKPKFDRFYVTLLILGFLTSLISIYLNLHFSNGLMEVFRWVKYLLIFIFFSSVSKEFYQSIIKALIFCFWVMVVVNIIQLVNPLNFGSELASIFTHHAKYSELGDSIDRSFRLVGTEINPNNNGVLWLIFFSIFLNKFHFQRKNFYLLIVGVSFLFIIFTQSRTSLVAAFLVLTLYLLIRGITLKYFIFLGITLGLGFAVIMFFNFTYIMQLFLSNPLELHSLKLRYAVWDELWNIYIQKPFFGFGSFENIEHFFKTPPDNEQFYILVQRGGVGFMFFLWILIYPIFFYSKQWLKSQFALTTLFLAASFLLIGFTNVTLSNIRVGMLFFAVCGIAYAHLNQKKLESQ